MPTAGAPTERCLLGKLPPSCWLLQQPVAESARRFAVADALALQCALAAIGAEEEHQAEAFRAVLETGVLPPPRPPGDGGLVVPGSEGVSGSTGCVTGRKADAVLRAFAGEAWDRRRAAPMSARLYCATAERLQVACQDPDGAALLAGRALALAPASADAMFRVAYVEDRLHG